MSRRIFSVVVLTVLGLIGSGTFPSYSIASPAIAENSHTPQQHASTSDKSTSDTSTFNVTITSVGNPTIREGEKLRVEALVTNTGDSALSLNADLRVHTNSFATRSHLLTFIYDADPSEGATSRSQEGTSDSTLQSVATLSAPLTLQPQSQTTITLETDTSALGWTAYNWGPRGVEVYVYASDEVSAYDRSLIVVEPSENITPMPTGIVVPLTDSRNELSALYTTDSLPHIRTEPTERIKNLASSMSMKGVSVIADPAYAALSQAPQTILSATADADIPALLDLHHDDIARALTAQTFAKGTAPVRVASPSSLEALSAYKELGASAFILDSSWCHTAQAGYATPSTHALLEGEGKTFDVLLNDSESAQAIVEARNSLQARQNAVALSAMTYLEQPSIIRPQLLYLDLSDETVWEAGSDKNAVNDYSHLAETTSALMNVPWVEPAQISDLLNTPANTSVQLSTDTDVSQASALTKQRFSSIEASTQEASIPASLVAEPNEVLAPVTIATTHLYSQNWKGNEDAYDHALTSFSFLAKDYANSVSAVPVSTINLVAEQADIPVRVQNTLNMPATVIVKLDSIDARLSAKNSVTVELPPASTTTVSIPVSAHGSGNVQAKIHLYNAQGVSVGTPTTVKVRVRAGWENNATIAVGIIVALLLVVGIVRSIRGGRRSEPVNPQDYTRERRNADLALARLGEKKGISPHNSP